MTDNETAARLIVEAGRRWNVAMSAWSTVEYVEERDDSEAPGLRGIAERASDEAEATIAAALDAGAMVAALLLRGIPAQAIAAAMSRQEKNRTQEGTPAI